MAAPSRSRATDAPKLRFSSKIDSGGGVGIVGYLH